MKICCFVLALLLTSCSGYRYSQTENPLQQYGIESLSIPMFYNYSSLSEVSFSFTKETYRLLSRFSGLQIKSGYHKDTDAVLIGIVKSPEKMTDTLKTQTPRVAQGSSPNKIGGTRQRFYIPGVTQVKLAVQFIIIKRPREEDLAMLQSEISPQLPKDAKIIFNETFAITESFNREVFDNQGTEVIATQNDGVLKRTQVTMAEKAAQQIRDMILYAF